MPSSRGSSPPWGRACVSYISCIDIRVIYHQMQEGWVQSLARELDPSGLEAEIPCAATKIWSSQINK